MTTLLKASKLAKKKLKIRNKQNLVMIPLFFVRDCESVTQLHVLKLLEEFKVNCGLEINTTKTEALWLGFWRSREESLYNFKWPKEAMHALAVYFSYNQEHANKLNLEEKVRSLETILNTILST